MVEGPTLGVLSTWFGGSYFGGLLGGIAAEVVAGNGRLIAIQTLDAGTFAEDFLDAPPFSHRVAWDYISGFIVFLNGANVAYLEAARSSGRPVVVISDSPVDFACPRIFPDNFSGACAATKHLIDHGHRQIAFVGYPGQEDVQERYQAYCSTLVRHGLTPDPDLFFHVDDMQESGGRQAGRAMLALGMPSTAAVTANDLVAIGLIHALSAAGLSLPADQAVIGFDDIDVAASHIPSLTTVRQPLAEIGALAARLSTQMIQGRDVANEVHQVATSLIIRESCGCTDSLFPANPANPADPAIRGGESAHGPRELLVNIGQILESRSSPAPGAGRRADLAACVEGIADALQAAVEGREGMDGLRLRNMLAPLSRMLSSNEIVIAVVQLIRQYGQQVQAWSGTDRDVDVTRRVEYCLHRIFIHLSQAQTSLLAAHGRSMMTSLATQNSISMELLRSQERDPRSLEWLQQSGVRGGCLGLWGPPSADLQGPTSLSVIRMFDRDIGGFDGPREDVGLESFPPAALMDTADISLDDMVYIAHLKVGSGDWGMLALVGPIEADVQEGRETMNQWAALLSVALEHEAVLKTLREQEEHLRRAALYDELTHLPNRSLFRTRLTTAMARAGRRADYRYAVLMLDLDGFKLVNDSLGHLAGDQLLLQVAGRLEATLRSIDTPARFGGDEFAVLLEEVTDEAGANVVAQRLQDALSAPHRLGDTEVVVSASIGIALGDPSYDGDTETLMRDADAAMYAAKASGKSAHAVFHPSMHAAAVNRLQLESELRRALDENELALHYQPIVDLRTDVISGAEALIRWQHPTRGLLAPGAFLPVAEESGLILAIGAWVLAEACRQLKAWGHGGPDSIPFLMSINVSNRQFWHGHLIDDVHRQLSSAGLSSDCLAIEITEGVIMHDVKLASSTLSGLKTLGVQVHIDDFGTGYSSLEALHDLSIDALKIDRSFVSRLTSSPRSRELVRTIVTMGLNLGLDVIAEGIETTEELDIVRALGCTHGQGYLYSRPVPAENLMAQMQFATARPADERDQPN